MNMAVEIILATFTCYNSSENGVDLKPKICLQS